jgi:hypothetical protein
MISSMAMAQVERQRCCAPARFYNPAPVLVSDKAGAVRFPELSVGDSARHVVVGSERN